MLGLGDDAERDVQSCRCPPESVLTQERRTRGQTHEFEQFFGDPGLSVTPGEHAHGFQHRQHSEVADLLQHDADPRAPTPPRSLGILAQDVHLPGIAFPVAFQDLDRRAESCPPRWDRGSRRSRRSRRRDRVPAPQAIDRRSSTNRGHSTAEVMTALRPLPTPAVSPTQPTAVADSASESSSIS